MQGLVVVGLIAEEISNVNIKFVKVTAARYIGQGHQVKNLQSQYIEEKHYASFGCCRPYILGDMKCGCKMCKSRWSAKYRSRSLGQGTCRVLTLRRSTMQGLVVVGLILEEISNINIKCAKVDGAQDIGQGRVKYLLSQ